MKRNIIHLHRNTEIDILAVINDKAQHIVSDIDQCQMLLSKVQETQSRQIWNSLTIGKILPGASQLAFGLCPEAQAPDHLM